MKKILSVAILVLMVVYALWWYDTPPHISEMFDKHGVSQGMSIDGIENTAPLSPDMVKSIMKKESVVLIDVRTPEERSQTGVLSGAMLLNMYASGFTDSIASLPQDKHYMIYCRSGNRSAIVRDMMRAQGYSVNDMQGGIQQRKYPTTQAY